MVVWGGEGWERVNSKRGRVWDLRIIEGGGHKTYYSPENLNSG